MAVPDDDGPPSIWFLHAGGLPLAGIGEQLSAVQALGRPRAYFDHDTVMFEEIGRRDVRTFGAYVEALMRDRDQPFSAFLFIDDLTWLDGEPTLAKRLTPPARFVHLTYRDPILQAIAWLEEEGSVTPAAPPSAARIADALVLLEERERRGDAWLRERSADTTELTCEDLASPGVAALRHMIAEWSIALPDQARIRPIDPPSQERLALAASMRQQLAARQWQHAAPYKQPHWHRRYTTDSP